MPCISPLHFGRTDFLDLCPAVLIDMAAQSMPSKTWSTGTLDAGVATLNFQGCKNEDDGDLKEIKVRVFQSIIQDTIVYIISMSPEYG